MSTNYKYSWATNAESGMVEAVIYKRVPVEGGDDEWSPTQRSAFAAESFDSVDALRETLDGMIADMEISDRLRASEEAAVAARRAEKEALLAKFETAKPEAPVAPAADKVEENAIERATDLAKDLVRQGKTEEEALSEAQAFLDKVQVEAEISLN